MNKKSNKLKNLFSELEKRKFPSFSANEELSSLIEDLIEVDAIYAGLLSCAIGGEKILKKNCPPLNQLSLKIHNFIPQTEADKKILKELINYMNLLIKIENEITT